MKDKNTSLTKSSVKNVVFTAVFELISLVLMFVARYLFLKKLSVELLAIDQMMKTVLGYIAFADLGITTIMTFFLFQPLKDKNPEKIKAILKFYRYVYLGIVGLSIILAIVFAFLLPVLFDVTVATSYNLYIIYTLFVVNLLLSYLFASKKTLLIADQRSYIVNGGVLFFQTIQAIIQIILLLTVSNYYLYTIVPCITTSLGVLFIHFYCKRHYDYLNKKSHELMPPEERKTFYKKIGDIIFFRIGTLMFNFTDNIIISLMLSTVMVGYAANYVLIVSAATTILLTAMNSLIGTIGAITTSQDKEKAYERYLKLNEIGFLIFLFTSLCMFGLSSPLISLLYGNEYILEPQIVFALSLSFFITGINQTNSLFRSAFGLFKEARFIPIACGVINIGLSVLLCLNMKLFGIYLATSIAKILTFNTFDTLLLHSKKAFSKSLWKRYIILFAQICIFLLGVLLVKEIVTLKETNVDFRSFIISILLCVAVVLPICMVYMACSPILIKVIEENVVPTIKGVGKKWFVRKSKEE